MKRVVLSILTLLIINMQAYAQEAQISISVRTVDLDLTTRKGVMILDRRIRNAALTICPDTWSTLELARLVAARRCVASVIKATDEQRERIIAAHRPRGEQ